MGNVNEYIRRHSTLESNDSVWRLKCADIADVIRPLRAEIRGFRQEGAKRMQRVYDSTPINAAQNLGAALWGNASNSSDVWFTIGTEDADFNKWPKHRSALETCSRRTMASFGPSYCNFYGEAFSAYLDFVAFGEMAFYDEKKADNSGWIDKCIPLSQYTYDLDSAGYLNEFYRAWQMKLPDAAREFGEAALSPKSRDQLKQSNAASVQVNMLHVVAPNDLYRPGRIGANSKQFESCYIEVDEKHEISSAGYDDMPFFVAPWERAAGERRGRGAGEMNLPDSMSLGVMTKANLKAGEMQGDPPWGAPHEGTVSAIRLRPGKISMGAITNQGNQLLKPLVTGGGTPFSAEQARDLRQQIKDGFYYTLLSTLPNRTGLAPEEVLLMLEQQHRMMGPYVSNLHTHWLSQLVMRRFNHLAKLGVFKDIQFPPQLQGKNLHVKFVSPMALAQKAARAANAMRAARAVGEVAGFNPGVIDKFNGDAFVDTINEGFGVPELSNDDDVTDGNRQARIAATQQAQQAQMADVMAGAANKGAGALAQLRQPVPGAR